MHAGSPEQPARAPEREGPPMLVALTGSTGLIGSALAAALHRGAMPALSSLALIRNPGVGPVGRATLNAAAGSRDNLKVAWT